MHDLLISFYWHHFTHSSVPCLSYKLGFRSRVFFWFSLYILARIFQRQCCISPLGVRNCMVIPVFVMWVNIGVHCLKCLCPRMLVSFEAKNGDVLILFIHLYLLDGILQWDTSPTLFGNQCYSLYAKYRVIISYLPLLTQFQNNELIS